MRDKYILILWRSDIFTKDNAIHWINCRSVGKCSQDKPCTPLDSDLSNGHRYPPFEQPRAEGRSGGGATRLEFRLHPRTSWWIKTVWKCLPFDGFLYSHHFNLTLNWQHLKKLDFDHCDLTEFVFQGHFVGARDKFTWTWHSQTRPCKLWHRLQSNLTRTGWKVIFFYE